MAFYQCSKCKRVWQYPIEKCPDCFLNLERVKSKKIKVIGISKVSIPTIFHPKVPYFALLLEDEKGNRWVQKSEKEYKIGNFIEEEKNRDGVAIWRVKYDFLEAIEKVIELLEDLEIKKDSKVLILPSLYLPSHPYFRDNTSPEFLEAVLKFLFQKGLKPENIKVGAQSFDEIPIEEKAKKSQLLEVCLKYKVIAQNLAKNNFLKKGDLEIAEEVFQSDLIFNLPILKIGKMASSENLLFLLKKENYLGLKYLFSDEEIFNKLKVVLPQSLSLAEAEVVQDEKKFNIFYGLLMASFNPFNLDRVFAEITKEEVPEILKKIPIENIPVLGRKISEVSF